MHWAGGEGYSGCKPWDRRRSGILTLFGGEFGVSGMAQKCGITSTHCEGPAGGGEGTAFSLAPPPRPAAKAAGRFGCVLVYLYTCVLVTNHKFKDACKGQPCWRSSDRQNMVLLSPHEQRGPEQQRGAAVRGLNPAGGVTEQCGAASKVGQCLQPSQEPEPVQPQQRE